MRTMNRLFTQHLAVSRLVLILALLLCPIGCASQKPVARYDSQKIIGDLESRILHIDSYAVDYIMYDRTIKRMYFLFKKDGRDFYMFRSDYTENGKPGIKLYNVDGKYDYAYYPEMKMAVRRPTTFQWNESNYSKARRWHADYGKFKVVGEEVVNGQDCYVLENGDTVVTVWKEKGLQTSMRKKSGDGTRMFYGNYAFNVGEETFTIPEGTSVSEQRAGANN